MSSGEGHAALLLFVVAKMIITHLPWFFAGAAFGLALQVYAFGWDAPWVVALLALVR